LNQNENPLNLDPRWGLVSRLETDGQYELGDGCANCFTVLYVDPLALPRHNVLTLLTSDDNWPRRSPDEYKWHGRPGRCSRDQLTPALCFTAVFAPAWFNRYMWSIASHCFLFANNPRPNFQYDSAEEHAQRAPPWDAYKPGSKLPDILGPDLWAVMLRGMCIQYGWLKVVAWLPLHLLDLHNALAVALHAYKPALDARNLTLKVHFSAHHTPTILSWLTWLCYKALKPQKQHESFWTQPGEPRVDLVINKLFED